MADDRTTLARTFDEVAELYDRARPGYQPEVFDDLVALAGLRPGARVLESGPGTGQATRTLVERLLAAARPVKLQPAPRPQPTLPNPCTGVPANGLCTRH